MQEAQRPHSPTQLAQQGDRAAAVTTAHQVLEDLLFRYEALAPQLVEGQRYPGGFNPWEEAAGIVTSISAATEVCLRLFSPKRKQDRFNALNTLSSLYAHNEDAGKRVERFLLVVRTSLGDRLTPAIAMAGGLTLLKVDPARGASLLMDFATSALQDVQARSDSASTATKSILFLGDKAVAKEAVKQTLYAAVECACRAGGDAAFQSAISKDLTSFFSQKDLADLQLFETKCRKAESRKAQRVALRSKRVAEGAPPAQSSAAVTQTDVTTAAAAAAQQPAPNNSGPFFLSGWRGQVLSLVCAVVLLLLLRPAARHVTRLLMDWWRATHSAAARKPRTLTL